MCRHFDSCSSFARRVCRSQLRSRYSLTERLVKPRSFARTCDISSSCNEGGVNSPTDFVDLVADQSWHIHYSPAAAPIVRCTQNHNLDKDHSDLRGLWVLPVKVAEDSSACTNNHLCLCRLVFGLESRIVLISPFVSTFSWLPDLLHVSNLGLFPHFQQMVILSEVHAGVELIEKLTTFAAQLNDGWYKGSAEVDGFRDKVWTLSAKHAQWNDQLRRYGISKNQHFLRLVQAADEALEKQQQYVLKLQKSWLLRCRRKVFPVRLSYYLNQLLEIVDAGPQLLAASVANYELLERHMAQTPVPLSFGPDANYVPMKDSILEVREALENPEGPRVVTVYGGPGMGKSMLVKYLALHYQEDKRRRSLTPHIPSFPDGVVYLSCGQKADDRVKQIQLELLESLGFGIRSQTPTDSNGVSGVQEGDYVALPSHQTKLRSRLAEQKLLIILDDLWEEVVLQEVLVPAMGVRYLVTSQLRDIYTFAEKIQIKRPTRAEASHIMANYTDGLPKKGEFPHHIKGITDDIIEKLEFHPLSLANIGISINRSRATDRDQWDVIRKDLDFYLDENDLHCPPAYDRRYNLAVSVSMMVMIESLPVEAGRLLFLMALLEGQQLPDSLVKFFYSFMQGDHFVLKYIKHERFLENMSLIDLTRQGNRSILDTHRLRSRYIREKRNLEVMSMGSEILMASGHQDTGKAIQRRDKEEALVTILSAMFYHQSFKDVVASTLEKQVKVFNDGIIPRRLNTNTDTLDLVENVRRHKGPVVDFVWLLNTDREAENWKQPLGPHSEKIIVNFVYQGKLDDGSMACLLQLPQTTSIACDALCSIYRYHDQDFYGQGITFSSAHGETMQALLSLFHNDTMSMKLRAAVMRVVLHTFDYHEEKETILSLAPKYKKFFAMDSNSCVKAFRGMNWFREGLRGGIIMAEFPGLLEDIIMALLLSENDHKLRVNAGELIRNLSKHKPIALRTANTPTALRVLFNSFLSHDDLREWSGDILAHLSMIPENRIKFGEVEDVWQGLGGIIAKLEEAWRAIRREDNHDLLGKRACVAAIILGYLALEEGFKETIASLPGIREGLLFFQTIEIAQTIKNATQYNARSLNGLWHFYGSTRALTILYTNSLDPTAMALPLLAAVLEACPHDRGHPSKATIDECYFGVYWTRVLAYIQMGSYAEALTNLYLAQHHLDQIQGGVMHSRMHWREDRYCQISSLGFRFGTRVQPSKTTLRDCRIFLLAMLEDYPEALLSATTRLEQDEDLPLPRFALLALAERGVLKRLAGDLQGALHDLDASLNATTMKVCNYKDETFDTHDLLWHRGYVKYLMDDKAGAREDAESAQQLKLNGPCSSDYAGFNQGVHLWMLTKLPVHYLEFSSK